MMGREPNIIPEYPVLVELVSQKVIVFRNVPDDMSPDSLVREAVQKDLVDIAGFDPVYLNACEARKDGSEAGYAACGVWEDIWAWDVTGSYTVQEIDLSDGDPVRAPLCIKVRCQNPGGHSDLELREELKIRLLASDGGRHFETVNWAPMEDVFFTVAPNQ